MSLLFMFEIYNGPVELDDRYFVVLKDSKTSKFETQEFPTQDPSLITNLGLCIGLTLDQVSEEIAKHSSLQITQIT